LQKVSPFRNSGRYICATLHIHLQRTFHCTSVSNISLNAASAN